ncbi:SA1362 family protein [Bacillus sp. CGMCC 1.16607]|uniref:SA1362 family protein n=1 Tax=Bacillus sp. CGMCC 1.16607 TaxID=3351842 RepID=UPI00362CE5C5
MAFLKNRTSSIFAISMILLALIGVVSSLVQNPAAFLQRIAVMILIGLTIYFVFKRFYKPSPAKKEQKAFLRAARKTKRKVHRKKTDEGTKTHTLTKLTPIRKKSSAHLTVIEGKKNKKKNRASF